MSALEELIEDCLFPTLSGGYSFKTNQAFEDHINALECLDWKPNNIRLACYCAITNKVYSCSIKDSKWKAMNAYLKFREESYWNPST